MIRQWVRTKESPEFASGFVLFEEMPKTNQGVFIDGESYDIYHLKPLTKNARM
jgi:hypothetical protein